MATNITDKIDFHVLQDLLSLVLPKPPPLYVLRSWSLAQCREAEKWAVTEHYIASDNHMRRRKIPPHLERYV